MTEGSVDDGNYLVLVRAQVMTRDDSSGGWVPLGGGGLSYVSVRKRALPTDEESKHEYLICGKRIADQVVVLSCTIKKDFEYYKVMPTFHHWRTGDKKFGLAFQTAADARAFNKGVQAAVDDLLEGSVDHTHVHDTDVGDDDVFMAIDLPVERGDSQSSSGSSGMGGSGGLDHVNSPYTHPHANHHYFHRMHYITRSTPQQQRCPATNNNNNGVNSGGGPEQQQQRDVDDVWAPNEEKKKQPKDGDGGGPLRDGDKIEILSEPYSYVQFARDRPSVHEYSYPVMDPLKGGGDVTRKDGGGRCLDAPRKLKGGDAVCTQQPLSPPLLPTKSKLKRDRKREKLKHLLLDRSRCKHCHEMFCEEDNDRGSCEYAPDCTRSCINAVTCLSCAQCMLYHCMSDAEGDFAHHPCSCDRTDAQCSRRWFGLAILSVFVPCLWCYLPMSSCHRCGVRYGLCGGRHEAS